MNFLLLNKFSAAGCVVLAFAFVMPTAMAQPVANPTPVPTILARGPLGTSVTIDDIESELQRIPIANRQTVLSRPDEVQQLIANLLIRRILAAEALRDGLDKNPIMSAALVVARDRTLSEGRLTKLDAQNTPSDEVVDSLAQDIYKANPARFIRPAETRARHILLEKTGPDALNQAKSLLAQLRGGALFETMAKAHSIDKGSAARGGDLGYFGSGQMVKPFEDALKALKNPGDLSEPVESQFGYHIIQLEARRPEGPQPYVEVRGLLMNEARTNVLNEGRIQKVNSLKKELVFEKNAIGMLTKPEPR